MSSWPWSDQDVREQKKRLRGYRGLYSLGRGAGITSAAAAEPAPNPSHVKTPLAHCQRRTVNAAYTLRNKVKRVLTLTDSAKLAPMPSGCAGGQGDWRCVQRIAAAFQGDTPGLHRRRAVREAPWSARTRSPLKQTGRAP